MASPKELLVSRQLGWFSLLHMCGLSSRRPVHPGFCLAISKPKDKDGQSSKSKLHLRLAHRGISNYRPLPTGRPRIGLRTLLAHPYSMYVQGQSDFDLKTVRKTRLLSIFASDTVVLHQTINSSSCLKKIKIREYIPQHQMHACKAMAQQALRNANRLVRHCRRIREDPASVNQTRRPDK